MPGHVSEKTHALILRSVDFGESDRILHLLVPRHGRLTAIAKGARRSTRRFAGTLDLFNHLRIQIQRRRGAAMSHLEQAVLVRQYAPLRSDPLRFALGCYLLELLDRLAPEGGASRDMQRLFRFALEALEVLATHRPDQALRTIVELRAFDALGLRPELRRCVGCGRELGQQREARRAPAQARRPTLESADAQRAEGERRRAPAQASSRAETGQVGFHVADGGPVCSACAAGRTGLVPIHLGTLRALEQGLELEIRHLDRLVLAPSALQEARHVVGRFQRFHVGVELHSERFLERLLSGKRSSARSEASRPARSEAQPSEDRTGLPSEDRTDAGKAPGGRV